jgi:hypothetical protein
MNIESLKLLKSPKKGTKGRKEKNRGDEPIQVIIHIYMEMSQGNSLCIYLKQTKMSFFFFLQNWKRQNRSCLGVGTSGKGEDVGKGCRRLKMVEISCILKLFQEWGKGEIKENGRGVNSTMI